MKLVKEKIISLNKHNNRLNQQIKRDEDDLLNFPEISPKYENFKFKIFGNLENLEKQKKEMKEDLQNLENLIHE